MIDVPDFRAEQLDLSRFDGDIGAAFQTFVGELLVAEDVDAHVLPAGGKDGGIDLIEELEGGGLKIYECKVTSEDDVLQAALQSAGEEPPTTSHATSPRLDGPPAGQSQYRPWYDRDRPSVLT